MQLGEGRPEGKKVTVTDLKAALGNLSAGKKSLENVPLEAVSPFISTRLRKTMEIPPFSSCRFHGFEAVARAGEASLRLMPLKKPAPGVMSILTRAIKTVATSQPVALTAWFSCFYCTLP